MRNTPLLATISILTLAILMMGMASPSNSDEKAAGPLKCKFTVGAAETVEYKTYDLYKNWVEMGPDAKVGQENMQQIDQVITMQRTVESVDDAGVALMKVTIESVTLKVQKKYQGKDATRTYVSNAEGTKSDFPSAPSIAGSSYSIKMAPDTTVKEILGIDELRTQLGLQPEQKGIVASLLNEDAIKAAHERASVQNGLAGGGSNETVVPVPNIMIIAEAIKKTYTSVKAEGEVVPISMKGEALHVRPEGVAEAPEPSDWGRSLIKDKSDMQEFKFEGVAMFSKAKGAVVAENSKLKSVLVLREEDVFPDAERTPKKESGNVMFTQVEMSWEFATK